MGRTGKIDLFLTRIVPQSVGIKREIRMLHMHLTTEIGI